MAGAAHAPMEPHAARRRVGGGRLTLWSGTQTPFNVRSDLAGLLRRARGRDPGHRPGDGRLVRGEDVRAPGGARRRAWPARPGGPVKAVLDRGEEFVTLNRHPAVVRVRIGARRDGTLAAKEVDCWADTGAYADCGPGVATKMGYAGVGPYRIPHVRVDSHGDLHEPAAQRRLPRLRRHAVGVGVGAHDGPAGARARHEPARAAAHATCSATATPSPPARSCTTCTSRSACRRPPTRSATRPTRAARACACCSRACRRRAAPRSPSSARRSATSCAAPRSRWARTCGSRSA